MGKCITSCGKDKARCCTDDCFLRVTEGSRLRFEVQQYCVFLQRIVHL